MTDFEDRTLDAMVDLVEGAAPADLEEAGDGLRGARDAIRRAAERLGRRVGRVDWEGEAGDAFRTWAAALVRDAELLADLAGAAGTQITAAGTGLASVRKAVLPLRDERPPSWSPVGPLHPAPVDDPATARREENRQEAVNQLNRLASFYAVAEQELATRRAPTFEVMPDVGVPEVPGRSRDGRRPPVDHANAPRADRRAAPGLPGPRNADALLPGPEPDGPGPDGSEPDGPRSDGPGPGRTGPAPLALPHDVGVHLNSVTVTPAPAGPAPAPLVSVGAGGTAPVTPVEPPGPFPAGAGAKSPFAASSPGAGRTVHAGPPPPQASRAPHTAAVRQVVEPAHGTAWGLREITAGTAGPPAPGQAAGGLAGTTVIGAGNAAAAAGRGPLLPSVPAAPVAPVTGQARAAPRRPARRPDRSAQDGGTSPEPGRNTAPPVIG